MPAKRPEFVWMHPMTQTPTFKVPVPDPDERIPEAQPAGQDAIDPAPVRPHGSPDLEEIARATHAACRELLDSDDWGRTGMNPDATHTILAMIATWGIPVLRIGDLHPARTWL